MEEKEEPGRNLVVGKWSIAGFEGEEPLPLEAREWGWGVLP